MSISAKVNTSSTIQGSVSQGNQPQVTRVTVPGPKGDSGAAGGSLVDLSDVDASSVSDGALIQYDGGTEKFVITNVVETDTGTIRLNGGTF
jgi:hypothetical protein|tara:strand:+ start:381 stop:653 length:273 start_codon:yes stop_codon:yes gene_type:complete